MVFGNHILILIVKRRNSTQILICSTLKCKNRGKYFGLFDPKICLGTLEFSRLPIGKRTQIWSIILSSKWSKTLSVSGIYFLEFCLLIWRIMVRQWFFGNSLLWAHFFHLFGFWLPQFLNLCIKKVIYSTALPPSHSTLSSCLHTPKFSFSFSSNCLLFFFSIIF